MDLSIYGTIVDNIRKQITKKTKKQQQIAFRKRNLLTFSLILERPPKKHLKQKTVGYNPPESPLFCIIFKHMLLSCTIPGHTIYILIIPT